MSFAALLTEAPDWLDVGPLVLLTDEARMQHVLRLAARNVAERGGGPFAAGVFESDSGRLVAAGVNRVVPLNCSLAHAETMALARAQQRLGCFDLAASHLPPLALVCSTEPCLMCLGAVLWSGVRRLVCGARSRDAAAIGFDEGPKPRAWVAELEKRGIAVRRDVCRADAAAVLRRYAAGGGPIYNSCRRRG
jgi:tRNA(Arg) A34 adenosine deaminase TadA